MAKERSSRKPKQAPEKENKDHHQQQQQLLHNKQQKWTLVRTLLGCNHQPIEEATGKCKKMKPTATPEVHRRRPSSSSLSSSSRSLRAPHPLNEPNSLSSSNSFSAYSSRSSSSINGGSGSSRGMTGLRRLSGCYECRMVVDPIPIGVSREPSPTSTICACPECGEIFTKPETMELHLSVTHAVSELGPEDTSKNIVEIIFQSSWLKKQGPAPIIDRVLKVHNTPKTISKFEDYGDSIKSKSTKKNPRCSADGNELLRFHSTMLSCSLGLNGSTSLCNSSPLCTVCEIIRNGFKLQNRECGSKNGILTTATSGRAHDRAEETLNTEEKKKLRAMMVCRVIAGRVKRNNNVIEGQEIEDQYDSVGGGSDNTVGLFSSLDELFVFNPRAILPCFVVIYHSL
ncbi:hypothetical protein CRG98_041164 [Punica granatum]|uniref:C2H2-type domain-containing protein n=1 Tax=Punica granatum TaxID=22663 RepID=A0A2I0I392_PUNGR|nr:hypothetical protein CRG98_041164 [Punica granatum]